MPKALTQDEFIRKSRLAHGDKYSYERAVYVNTCKRVIITCPEHGDFEQLPTNHYYNKHGCPECGFAISRKARKKNTEEFIEDAIALNGDRYDYSQVVYKNSKKKVKIICREHGVFLMRPNDHLNGVHCPKCAHPSKRKTAKQFIEDAGLVHNGKYDYSEANYKRAKVPVVIICPKHGRFKQEPNYHLMGKGCPRCNDSHGEREVAKTLESLGIDYKREYWFPDCRLKMPLKFDFYFEIGGNVFLIEYDGRQHYVPLRWFGGKKKLELIKKRDKIKTDYAKENGYRLIRIPYTQKQDIHSIIQNEVEMNNVSC